jgi:hypothetical protein
LFAQADWCGDSKPVIVLFQDSSRGEVCEFAARDDSSSCKLIYLRLSPMNYERAMERAHEPDHYLCVSPAKTPSGPGANVIRQAISCDICGAEKRQTNHWFVAYEQGEELRLCGWSSRQRKRPGSKHLCGQKCLHKLVDDYMARAIAVRLPASEIEAGAQAAPTDTSLTNNPARTETAPGVHLVAPVHPAPLPQLRAQPELAPLPPRSESPDFLAPLDDPPHYASRNWRTQAWEREREREMRTGERRPDLATRRGS